MHPTLPKLFALTSVLCKGRWVGVVGASGTPRVLCRQLTLTSARRRSAVFYKYTNPIPKNSSKHHKGILNHRCLTYPRGESQLILVIENGPFEVHHLFFAWGMCTGTSLHVVYGRKVTKTQTRPDHVRVWGSSWPWGSHGAPPRRSGCANRPGTAVSISAQISLNGAFLGLCRLIN